MVTQAVPEQTVVGGASWPRALVPAREDREGQWELDVEAEWSEKLDLELAPGCDPRIPSWIFLLGFCHCVGLLDSQPKCLGTDLEGHIQSHPHFFL